MSPGQVQYGASERRVIPHVRIRLRSAISSRYLFQVSFTFVAYVLAGKLGQATANIRSSNLGPVWPAYGIALAAVLICGYRVWPGVAAGAFLVAFLSPVSHLAALGQAAGSTVAAVIGVFLLYRIANFNTSLFRLSDALSLIAIGGFGSATISASIGTLVLYASHVHAYSGWGTAWLIYWLGDATGVLLVTPLVLTIPNLLQIRDRARIAELGMLLSLLAVVCFVVFSDAMVIPARILSFIVLPFVMWAAIRFGVSAAALAMLIVASAVTIETASGSGPFATRSPSLNAEMLDWFFGVLSVTGLTLAALVTEREHAEREREQLVSEQATLEAKLEAADILLLSDERWRLAAQAGKMYAYEWNVATDAVVRSGEVASVLGTDLSTLTRQEILARVHPDDRALFLASTMERTPDNPDTQISYRVLDPDGSVRWLGKTAHAYFDRKGRMVRMIGMVTDITECKLGEDKLREYERAIEGSEEMIAVVDREYRYLIANRQFLKMRRMTTEQVVGRFAYEVLNEGVFETSIKARLDECFQGRVVRYEMRYRYPDLGERDLLVSYFPIEGTKGVDRAACIIQDITDRKTAEKALADMNGKLIEAQEQERARIGKELHDNINQRLALLAVEVETSHETPLLSADAMYRLLNGIKERIIEVSSEVQSLSHELYSTQLEYLGLIPALKGFCRELSERQKIEIDFIHDQVPSPVASDISLCLLRVLQEALHNATKHSQVRQFKVRVGCLENQIQLTVSDRGAGFEVATAMQRGGIGLISMRERVRSVHGTIAIESRPMNGTTIHVWVPLKLGPVSQLAVG